MPAAFNGIVGLKPSLGALSASGLAPACRTLDTISIFARDVADAFTVFQAACASTRLMLTAARFPTRRSLRSQAGFAWGFPHGSAAVLR